MRAALGSIGVLSLLFMLAEPARAAEPQTPTAPLTLRATAYPQALPNDGRSESAVTVVATDLSGAAAAGVKLLARVTNCDGVIREREAVTDETGRAVFHYRAGVTPRPALITVTEAGSAAQAELTIPLAAVSYLDLLLVTPADYAAHKRRQASAAPIYKLALDVFPRQLAADGGSASHVTATLTFTDGQPAPGVPLKAEVTGSDARIDTSQRATDSTGRMSFYFSAGRTPGTATVRIIEPSTGLTTSASLLLVEAGPTRVELLIDDSTALGTDHDGTLMPADGYSALPLKLRVTDLYGSPLTGVEVRLEVLNLGTGWVELRTHVSNSFGEIEGVYHAGSAIGKVRLRAYAAAGLPAM